MEYRRYLPHIQPINGDFFVTFRLFGSLPNSVLTQIKQKYKSEIALINNTITDENTKNEELSKIQKRHFSAYDNYLDTTKSEPFHLRNEEIANLVKESIQYYHNKDYELICYSIMSNHVHLVIKNTQRDLYRIMQSIKRFTARKANHILNRTGENFWAEESYDHIIRDVNELSRIIKYTLNNPVKINAVKDWTEWKHSYCNPDFLPF